LPLRPPVPRGTFEDTGAPFAAGTTATVFGEVPAQELVPVAPDECLAAAMAVRAVAVRIVDVADVRVADPVLDGNPTSPDPGGGAAVACPSGAAD